MFGQPLPAAIMASAEKWERLRDWLPSAPGRVDDLVARWSLEPDGNLYTAGQCSIVAPVVDAAGRRCVLKVPFPHPEAEVEADALIAYGGRGAVALYERDVEHNAVLLERCEPGSSAWTAGDRAEIIGASCEVMRRLSRPVDAGHPFDDLHAARRGDVIRQRFVKHGRPFDAGLAEDGARTWDSLDASTDVIALVHGDFHPDNVLRAEREPWLAVDPKPLAGDPAFDTAQLLLNFNGRGWPMGEVISEVASSTGFDRDRVAAWVFARAVEEITWTLEDGGRIDDTVDRAESFAQLR